MNRLNRQTESGFTLVEFMIAGLLGILLIGGAVQLFIGSSQSNRIQNSLASLQENGRFAIQLLKRTIEKGSWSESYHETPNAVDFSLSEDKNPAGSGGNQYSDSLAIAFNAKMDGVSNIDCSGELVPNGKVVNQFYVNGNSQLVCKGRGSTTEVAFVENVRDFQVLYGVEEVTGTNLCQKGTVSRYLNASLVTSSLQNRIRSIRVGLLLESKGAKFDNTQTSFNLLDQQITLAASDTVKRIFQQTVFMPNMVFASAGNPQMSLECSK